MPDIYQDRSDSSYQEYLEYIRDHAIIVSDPGDEQEHIYNLL